MASKKSFRQLLISSDWCENRVWVNKTQQLHSTLHVALDLKYALIIMGLCFCELLSLIDTQLQENSIREDFLLFLWSYQVVWRLKWPSLLTAVPLQMLSAAAALQPAPLHHFVNLSQRVLLLCHQASLLLFGLETNCSACAALQAPPVPVLIWMLCWPEEDAASWVSSCA